MTIQPQPVQSPDLELRAYCDLIGSVPGGVAVKALVGFARVRACHECQALAGVAHAAGCRWWAERGLGLPQYAGDVHTGYRPIRAAS